MEKSAREIVKTVETIANNHKLIRDFGQGDVFEINAKERLMPLLWMEFIPSTIYRNRMEFKFRLYAMDLVDQAETQQLDVHSDTLLYLNDVLKELRTTEELIAEGRAFTVTSFEHNFNADVSGWFTEVTLDLENVYGPCDYPKS